MLHLGGNEAPEAYLVLATIVQRSSNKVHHVKRWTNAAARLLAVLKTLDFIGYGKKQRPGLEPGR